MDYNLFNAPDFWWQNPGFRSLLLSPFSLLYNCILNIKKTLTVPISASCPVISVGNIVLGGAGKTPITIELVKILKQYNKDIKIICKGYNAKCDGPLEVNNIIHDASFVSEEALMLSQYSKTYIAKNKSDAFCFLSNNDIAIIDDGHQSFKIKKDLSFIVINSLQMFGNGYTMPAGPLRENAAQSLQNADGIFLIYDNENEIDFCITKISSIINKNIPIILTNTTYISNISPNTKVIGFSSIGYPKKFIKTINNLDLSLTYFKQYPDHHIYNKTDELELVKISNKHKSLLVTTEKDYIKLSNEMKKRVYVIKQSMHFINIHLIQSIFDTLMSSKNII